MKESFFDALCELAQINPDIEFIKADAGFNAKYQTGYSKQYLNIGISEQNMIGVAAGMALEGKIVFAYSLVDFTSLRVLDQIRVNMGYNRTNVTVVSCGTGFDYCDDGVSHIAVDDISALRAIPNLTLFSPCDPYEAFVVTKTAAEIEGPCFIRLGRGGERNLHKADIVNYKVGDVLTLKNGNDVVMLVTGSIAGEVLKAAESLSDSGVDVGVYSFPTIKPLNRDFIEKIFDTARLVVTVEEHILPGGFGSAVAEIVSEIQSHKAVFKRIGVVDGFQNLSNLHSEADLADLFHKYAPPAYMRRQTGITADAIEKLVRANI